MPEAKLGSIRRTQSLRRSVGDRDDRGWTLLHVGARRGDVREVRFLASVSTTVYDICN